MSSDDSFHAAGPTPGPDANTPPSGQWSQGPTAQVPPSAQWQFPPPRPTGFFNSLRYSGWYRGDNRVIGGVCSGISARTGWDLTLVRGLTVVLAVFVAPVLVAYALYWVFLPEQSDGRIHAEELLRGHFDAAQLGALVLVLLGLGNASVLNGTWGNAHGVLWNLVGIAIVIAAVIGIIAAATSGTRTPPPVQPHQAPSAPPPSAGPQAPGRPGAPSPQWTEHPGAHTPSAPAAAPLHTQVNGIPAPAWSAPVARFAPRRVSTALTLSVTGLVVLLIAGALFAMYWLQMQGDAIALHSVVQTQIMLVCGGVCLLIVGIVLAVAATHDRGAGGLVALSVVGVLMAAPAALVGLVVAQDGGSASVDTAVTGTDTYGTDTFDWRSNEATSSSGAGTVVLDLTGAPQHTRKTIHVDGNMGEVRVIMRQDQPVAFDIAGGVGSVSAAYWTDDEGEQVSSDWVPQVNAIYDSLDFRNDAWSTAGGITLDIDSILGNVSIEERAPSSSAPTPTPSPSGTDAQSGGAQSGASAHAPEPHPTTTGDQG